MPLPVDDPRHRRPDIGYAAATLDWKPEISLREGLGKTIAYFDKQLTSPRGRRQLAAE
jgi:UDP-glucuronate decarboxylase